MAGAESIGGLAQVEVRWALGAVRQDFGGHRKDLGFISKGDRKPLPAVLSEKNVIGLDLLFK